MFIYLHCDWLYKIQCMKCLNSDIKNLIFRDHILQVDESRRNSIGVENTMLIVNIHFFDFFFKEMPNNFIFHKTNHDHQGKNHVKLRILLQQERLKARTGEFLVIKIYQFNCSNNI